MSKKFEKTRWFSCDTPPMIPGIYETALFPAGLGYDEFKLRRWDGENWRFLSTDEVCTSYGYSEDFWRGLKKEAGK